MKQFPERPPGKTKNNKTNHRNRRQPFTRFTTLLRSIECTYSMRCGLFSGAHKMQRLRCQQTKQVKERERAAPCTMLALRAPHSAKPLGNRSDRSFLRPNFALFSSLSSRNSCSLRLPTPSWSSSSGRSVGFHDARAQIHPYARTICKFAIIFV